MREVEGLDFKYTTISLVEAYEFSFKHALEMIKRNGGEVDASAARIKLQEPRPVPLEVGFEGHFPAERRRLDIRLDEKTREAEFAFEGIGFVINGAAVKTEEKAPDEVLELEIELDAGPAVMSILPTDVRTRKPTPFWRYQLSPGPHTVRVRLLNPASGIEIHLADVVIHAEKPAASA
ncbi:MAG: hypothetical protein AB1715_13160 [Acidobacteriota bacterium]